MYVATGLGVQILDQTGRVNAILSIPGEAAIDVSFGEDGTSELFVTSREGAYRRLLNAKGAGDSGKPIKPAKPKL